jgi:DNA polymerase III gamma/tau subunit
MRFMPMQLKRKIYIFDEVHQLTQDSQQVLLKTFEEPNEGLLIFMCTTQTNGLDKALLDRAEKVSFKSLSDEAAILIVDQVVKAAGREVSKEIRGQLIDGCDGSARALLNNVQAYLDGGFDPVTVTEEEGGADVKELALALVAGDWGKTADILKRPAVKAKPEGIRIAVESFVRAMVLNSNTINVRAVAALTTLVGTVSTEPGISQYNRFVFKCVKACQNKI